MKSKMKANPAVLWGWLGDPAVFRKVTAPVMEFRSEHPESFPDRWQEGRSYQMNMYLFGIVPLGYHTIHFRSIDDGNRQFQTMESGRFIRHWEHTMRVRVNGQGDTYFEDELVIRSGALTIFIYVGAYLFFLYRHWRIRNLLRRIG
ncbi:hypothetical protein FHS18_001932 [Paenibacillus phyllosphaerae]|uniref:Ligand-binding SRPBCC domain-containing protein n=1 Tax=Paenibacillus phyllosphaerae TaxID=274593 RepID=A0A7W5AWN6_9BACL|nr:hypothetical protein [Paenibacillus phyllosphaerae]MBB3109869.1 hypothetical protein [Paenibacillus phyllosphaerae]